MSGFRAAQIERSSCTVPNVSEIAIQADCDGDDTEIQKDERYVLDFTNPFLFSDAILVVQGRNLHCHRAILSIYSPVFKAMFQNRCIENQKNEVVIPVDEFEDIREMLRHMYTPGGCDMTAETAEKLLPILHRYQIDSLVSLAERTLTFRLNDATAPVFLRIADLYGLSRLRQAALDSCARLDYGRMLKAFEEINISPELKNEVLERRIKVLEKCLIDIQQSFTHSCSRMESRAERVPSNHCSLHSRPFSTITFNPVVNSTTGQLVNCDVDQNSQNGDISDAVRLDVTSGVTQFSATRNSEMRTGGDNVNTGAVQRETDPNPSIPTTTTTTTGLSLSPNPPLATAVCEQCVEQFKTHIQELCKRGLHKIPIITCRNP
uniref:SJCHGC09428 protein n=1 Tax=Schistosoma japonicum TaxID=6182 RepID=Q5DG89_SCHJA|nr:SJCHGC09428 protein [Schistosoma japonicum]